MKQGPTRMLLALLVTAFVFALAWIFQLRFERGDIYPRYSSLRSDPYGLKGWYEGLRRIEGLRVSRNFRPLARLDWDAHSALVLAGVSPRRMPLSEENLREEILAPVARGARLILALGGSDVSNGWRDSEFHTGKDPNRDPGPSPEDATDRRNDPNGSPHWSALERVLDFRLDTNSHEVNDVSTVIRPLTAPLGLAPTMPWLGTRTVRDCNACWSSWYRLEGKPVVLTRSWGQGSVVILTDSYLLSNEAQSRQRQTVLLTHLLGSQTHVVFDETHLGIGERAGIVTLTRKYRLHGFLGGLLVLTGLLVWQRSVGLIETTPAVDTQREVVIGKDTRSGLTSLLQRSIAPHALLIACLDEWSKGYLATAAGRQRYGPAAERGRRLLEAASTASLNETQRLTLYRDMTEILKQRENHE